MKVQFEFSAADLAEAGNRAVNRSPLVQKWRLRIRWIWAFAAGMIAFFAVPASMEIRMVAALIVTAAVFIAVAARVRAKANPRVLEFYRERLGGDGPFICEVEITDAAVITRQLGAETRHGWSHVQSIVEAAGGIEIIYRPLGSTLVRDRAFADAQARAEFLQTARRFMAQSIEQPTANPVQ